MQIQRPTGFVLKYSKLVITATWLLTTFLYLYYFGLTTTLEAEKYISEARHFLDTGSLTAPRFWFYSVTIFIIAVSLKLQMGLWGAFAIQAIINLFAYLFFFKALLQIFTKPLTALLLIIYLLLFWPYQSWVTYLYTESVFFSSILILTSVLILYKPAGLKNFVIISLSLLLTVFSRPLGVLFIISTYIYIFWLVPRRWKYIFLFFSLLCAGASVLIINTIFSSIPDWQITQAFEEESIICGLPAISEAPQLHLATSGTPLYRLYFYIFHNYSHFLKFTGIKLQYFFLMRRPYYSNAHNIFLLLNLAIVYLLGCMNIFRRNPGHFKNLSLFLVSIIILYALTVVFQCDDYHNRFILSIYPFFAIPAAFTLEKIYLRFSKNNI